ncbi:MAG: O-antigen ligase family protein [Synechococcales cyanobacterium CRU_2_2]|nr:O-antigen ligase family protein [Synechococcales cyanobacterium CRU_2_2]
MAGLVAGLVGLSLVLQFEWTVIALLLVRSSLDLFSEQQLPAIFAVALDFVAIVYILLLVLLKKPIKADSLFMFFSGWIALQGVWLVLLPLGGLGPSGLSLSDSLREWVRMSSWLILYLLVSQLQDRLHPEKAIRLLFLSLLAPMGAAILQIALPPSLLPKFLLFTNTGGGFDIGSRINGTLGHPATFASFLVLFIALTLWKFLDSPNKLPWGLVLCVLVFFLVSTKALTGLLMFVAFLLTFMAPRLTFKSALGGIILVSALLLLFGSSEFGRERLASIANTPLLNSDIDWSRAVVMGQWDGNSFNWRITQWTFLLQAWQKYPLLGYGIGSSSFVTVYQNYAHNDYVRALTEGGILGLALFIVLLAGIAVRLWRLYQTPTLPQKQRNLALTLFAILAALAFGMLTDNIWSHTTLFFYFWLLVAVVSWDWTPEARLETRSCLQPSV